MKKVLFIYNPEAGDGEIKKNIDEILDIFSNKNILPTLYRISKGNDVQIEKVIKEEDFDEIFIAGGDGTVNNCINKIIYNNIDVPIAILPSGTVNDFSASLGIKGGYMQWVGKLIDSKIKKVDIGLINDEKYFVATLAGGLFVNVSYNTSSDMKKAFGPSAYYIKGMTEVTNKKSFRIKIESENEVLEEDVLLFLVTNGEHAAGFSQIVDNVSIDDGLMDLVIIKNCPGVELFGLFLKALRNNLLDDKNVKRIKASKFTVSANEELKLSIDGERACSLPVTVEVLKRKLSFHYIEVNG